MSHIKLSVPNDDSCALFHIGKSLIDLSSTIEGSPYWVIITQKEYDELKTPSNVSVENAHHINIDTPEPEIDTATQQLESLAFLNKLNEEKLEDPDSDEGACVGKVTHTTDSNGTPWDERIHSASKALNSDGTWRLRRKPKDMDETEWTDHVAWVQESLRVAQHLNAQDGEIDPEHYATESAEGMNDIAEPSVTPVGDDFHVDAGEVTEQQIASIPAPPLPVPPAPPVQQSDMTFPQVMQFLTERHGRITSAQVDDIIADMGLNSIMDLNTQPEHIGPFIARVKALLGE